MLSLQGRILPSLVCEKAMNVTDNLDLVMSAMLSILSILIENYSQLRI